MALDTSLEGLSPAEKIKKIEELQKEAKEELASSEEAFEQEKKEKLAALEKAEEELAQAKQALHEQEEKEVIEQEEVASLDTLLAAVPLVDEGLEKELPASLYEFTDYNLYGELSNLEKKGYMTLDEQRRVASLRSQVASISSSYSSDQRNALDRNRGNYLSRTEKVLEKLNSKLHDLQDGMYNLDERPDHHAVYQ